MIKRFLSLTLLMLLVASVAMAQSSTSGALVGRVSDATGAVPGVTVEITSPTQPGTKVAVTDSNGEFRFSSLTPGTYTLTANLSGYSPLNQSNINVGLNRTTTLDLTLRPANVSETITVTADAPVVDVTSNQTGANVTSETIESLPLARDFYAVAQIAPGTSSDAAGTTVYGSTGAENQYIIDGLNTTGVENGTAAKTLNFDFIQEVQVITGGLPAEYGRVTGGVVNAITKTGGNEFKGDAFAYGSGGALQSDNTTAGDRPATATTIGDVSDQFDFGFNVGGYVVRDRLWFFAAYDRVNETDTYSIIRDLQGAPGSPAIGSELDEDVTRDLYAGKLTWQATANQNLTLSILGDPSDYDGALGDFFGSATNPVIAGPPSTFLGHAKTGGNDGILRYSGVFGNWLLNGTVGRHHEESYLTGPGKSMAHYIDQTVPAGRPLPVSGGFAFHQDQEFDRDAVKLDVTRYIGRHELKVGGDREKLSAYNESWNGGGGQRIYIRRNANLVTATNPNGIYYRHRYYINDRAANFDRDNPATWQINIPLTTTPETVNTSFFAQDSWKITPNFTLNAGLRWERQDLGDRFGSSAVVLDDMYAPRLGVIWDVMRNGRSKLFANYGRFYESIPMDMNIRAFGGELQAFAYNFSSDPKNFAPDPFFAVSRPGTGIPRNTLTGGATPVDPDLKGQYVDEMLLGYEYELANNLAVGVQGTYRKLGRVVEDFLDPVSGQYHIANPGVGSGVNMAFYDYEPAIAPDVKRTFEGVQLHARKRFSNSAQFYASYLWSRLEGNYDGLFQASTGQLDPNINSAFDYADFMINNEGLLSNDRTHQFKFNGSYTFNGGMANGLTVGLSTYYASGYPLNAYGYSPGYQNYEFYLVPRGSLGRGPSEYEADLHFGYPINFGQTRVSAILDVFNVLNRQSATRLDERYNLSSDADACAGIPETICGPGGGILYRAKNEVPQAAGVLTNPRATATNPDFLTGGTQFTPARSLRLGLRLSF
ncbi:MAG: TonB-dependent receptor [Acidobacteriota bacterium]|nr:TonB-dependent receptor [Acidobacteriota bacterium]